jgi:hypothetical protein
MGVVPGKGLAWIGVMVLVVGEGTAAWAWVLGDDVTITGWGVEA